MKLKLTRETINSIRADGKDRTIFDATLSSFTLRATKAGSKIFIVHARVNGKVRRVTIGRYGEIALNDARHRAKEILAQMATGDDPALTRAKRKLVLSQFCSVSLNGNSSNKENGFGTQTQRRISSGSGTHCIDKRAYP